MVSAASPESLRDELQSPAETLQQAMKWTLAPLASLKLTVALFACSLVIILVGTLAQTEKDMWEVKNDYFESYITFVEFNVMMPKSFFPNRPDMSGGVYFPGGALIGLMLILNLVSAHLIRFKVQAKGTQLAIGLVGMLVGVLITTFVIMGGHSREGIQGLPFFDYQTLWLMLKLSLVAFWLVSVYATIQLFVKRGESEENKTVEISLLGTVVTLLTLLIGYLLVQGNNAALGDSSMRILWQLIQGMLCGGALLFGAIYLFNQRAGIVIMHLGVGLLMMSELLVSLSAVEQQMTIFEGETAHFARDIRTTEIAFIAPGADSDKTVVVPRQMLERSAAEQEKITDPNLPVDLLVREYLKNSNLVDGEPGAENPSNAGAGKYLLAEPMRATGGAESSGEVDFPSCYVEFFKKGANESLGVYMLSTMLTAQDFEDKLPLDGQDHFVSLRFKRTYKPYAVTLLETNRVNYAGTSKAKHYESKVLINFTGQDKVVQETIWMNNPLRVAGETFYQSGHDTSGGREYSVLSVVANLGWMIPYIACMIVATGMFFHFGLTLRRYLRRRHTTMSPIDFLRAGGPIGWISALVIVVVLAGYSVSKQERLPDQNGMDLQTFASLPVLFEGRYQPLDTLARNSLKVISDREHLELYYEDEKAAKDKGLPDRIPAVVWLLDVIADKKVASTYRVFRIDHPEIQNILELERRKGHRYSVSEILPKFDKVEKIARDARAVEDKSKLSVMQRRVVELTQRTRAFMGIVVAFRAQEIPKLDYREALRKIQAGEELDDNTFAQLSMLRQIKEAADEQDAQLAASEPPLLVPVDGEWKPFATAKHGEMFAAITGQRTSSLANAFDNVLDAYRDGHGGIFNKNVAEYKSQVFKAAPEDADFSKLDWEASYNRQSLFGDAMVLYFIAFLMLPVGFLSLVWSRGDTAATGVWLNRFAFLLITAAFLIHSHALISRVMISGRPPVTNLYSSAVFIGWGCVVFGLVLELFYRYGIGNLVAAIAGFATLIIANKLSGDGDTMKVLVAVLDTQFWLATHVVCITLGYATTFLAGLVGAIFVLGGVFTPAVNSTVRKELARMIYAILCFSIFFSFIGTVLGGLWADDSWGRFWGWDPKENGALMIVVWNALVLHARWGAMIKERGMAVLSVGGMIVTAWSWFGVNELGVGLHSYGFTDGVLLTLGICIGVMLLIMAIGVVPNRLWMSNLFAVNQVVAKPVPAAPNSGSKKGRS